MRAYRKIAAHLVVTGRLPMFEALLEAVATGAILTMDRATGATWAEVAASTELSEADKDRLDRVNWLGPSKWGVIYPEMLRAVRAGKLLDGAEQKARRSAHSMLQAVKARRVSERR